MSLQGHAEMVRPHGQPEFSCEIIEDFIGTNTLSVRLHGFERSLAQFGDELYIKHTPILQQDGESSIVMGMGYS